MNEATTAKKALTRLSSEGGTADEAKPVMPKLVTAVRALVCEHRNNQALQPAGDPADALTRGAAVSQRWARVGLEHTTTV